MTKDIMNINKAVSVPQPYATQIAKGELSVIIKPFGTPYRGDIIICASKIGYKGNKPTGVTLCQADLFDVKTMSSEYESITNQSYNNGDCLWFFKNVSEVEHKPVTGRVGVFSIAC